MADVITQKNQLQFDYAFVDGDTRISYINNPKDSISAAEIDELNTYIRANNLIVGDKFGSTFAQINKVTRINKTTTTLDLNP